jgi:hypothetical protein
MGLLVVGSGFACGWACYAALQLRQPFAAIGIALALVITIALIAGGRGMGRPPGGAPRPAMWVAYLVNLVFEFALLNIAYMGLARIGRLDLMIPGISAAVALHFLPMARIFRTALFLWVGLAMLAGALVAVAAIQWSGLSAPAVSTIEALLNALILWGSVAATVRMARNGWRRTDRALNEAAQPSR